MATGAPRLEPEAQRIDAGAERLRKTEPARLFYFLLVGSAIGDVIDESGDRVLLCFVGTEGACAIGLVQSGGTERCGILGIACQGKEGGAY